MQLLGNLHNIATFSLDTWSEHLHLIRKAQSDRVSWSTLGSNVRPRRVTRLIGWRKLQAWHHALTIVGILQHSADGALRAN